MPFELEGKSEHGRSQTHTALPLPIARTPPGPLWLISKRDVRCLAESNCGRLKIPDACAATLPNFVRSMDVELDMRRARMAGTHNKGVIHWSGVLCIYEEVEQ
jgi:hypothetical protein